jgi:hypothetical protein
VPIFYPLAKLILERHPATHKIDMLMPPLRGILSTLAFLYKEIVFTRESGYQGGEMRNAHDLES